MRSVLCFAVLAAVVLGCNVSAMADFVITDTFSRSASTVLGATEAPGVIHNWVESVSDASQNVSIDASGVMVHAGYLAATATIDGLDMDLFTQTVDISVDFSMVGTGEALVEYMKGGNSHPFNEAAYFVAVHPTGVISLKRNDSGNIVDLARVENLTLSNSWVDLDQLDIHVEMVGPGVVKSILSHNGTEIVNVVDSSINARAFGTVGFSSYGGWTNNVIYDNLEIAVTEIPEPATVVLLSIGGLATYIKRKGS